MKKTVSILAFAVILLLCGCSMESYVPQKNEVIAVYKNHSADFNSAVALASEFDRDIVISNTNNYKIQSDDPKYSDYSGLYLSDTTGGYETYENDVFERLLTEDGVKTVSAEKDGKICEFNCGGGGRYYRGIYYTKDGEAKNLVERDGELTEENEGLTFKNDAVYYYTEKIADNFFYYELDA